MGYGFWKTYRFYGVFFKGHTQTFLLHFLIIILILPNFWKWSLYPPPRCNIVNTRSCQSLIFSKSTLFVRIILACLHFIENVQRQKKNKTKEGKKYIHINFPKFSLGSEVVQQVAVDPGGTPTVRWGGSDNFWVWENCLV